MNWIEYLLFAATALLGAGALAHSVGTHVALKKLEARADQAEERLELAEKAVKNASQGVASLAAVHLREILTRAKPYLGDEGPTADEPPAPPVPARQGYGLPADPKAPTTSDAAVEL